MTFLIIIIMVFVVLTVSLIAAEIQYKCDIDKRKILVAEYICYWIGSPGYMTDLIICSKDNREIDRIPFLMYSKALYHTNFNKLALESLYIYYLNKWIYNKREDYET